MLSKELRGKQVLDPTADPIAIKINLKQNLIDNKTSLWNKFNENNNTMEINLSSLLITQAKLSQRRVLRLSRTSPIGAASPRSRAATDTGSGDDGKVYGYWVLDADGAVYSLGGAQFWATPASTPRS
jgi:hypothetical protein